MLGAFWCREVPVPLAGLLVAEVHRCHVQYTYCDGLKTVGDLHSFSVGLWVHQLGAHVWSSVTCWYICPVCVLLFCILNNREFRDSFFLNDQASCSESRGVHPAASAAVYCISPEYHRRFWYPLLIFSYNGRLRRLVNICFLRCFNMMSVGAW